MREIGEALYYKHVRTVEQVGGINADEFGVLNKALHRLERFWTDRFSTDFDETRQQLLRGFVKMSTAKTRTDGES